MTASEKLTQLIENDKLTDDQLDNLNGWGIQKVSDLEYYLIDNLQLDTHSVNYERTITTLYTLLDYNDDEYVVYDVDSVQELDFDTLNDALDVD